MKTRTRFLLASSLALLQACAFTPGAQIPASAPSLTFAAYGDMPYMVTVADGRTDEQVLIQDIAPRIRRHSDIPFVIHLGDLGRPEVACTDAWLQKTRMFWETDIVKPVFYTPGDNEWTDCDRGKLAVRGSELARLDAVRQTFFSRPVNLDPAWRYERQDRQPENATWWHKGVRFVTQHVVSKDNGRKEVLLDDPARASSLADEREARNQAWLDRAFDLAAQGDTAALVVAMQFDPFGAPDGTTDALTRCTNRPAYKEFCLHLQALAARLDKPVLLIHGDTNAYCLDQPFSIAVAPKLWRLNAPGDYQVIDAAVIAFDPGNAGSPFNVTGLLSGQAAPKVCNYERHE